MTTTRLSRCGSRLRRLALSLPRWCPASAASLNGRTNLRPFDLLTYIRTVRRSETYQPELSQAIREQAKINAEQPISLDGVLVSDPTEEHSWPIYGGIPRVCGEAYASPHETIEKKVN